MLPHVQTELAAAHLLDDQSRRDWHAWYRSKFILPFREGRETETRFVPARVGDNRYNNPEYQKVLEGLTGGSGGPGWMGIGTLRRGSSSRRSGARCMSSRISMTRGRGNGLCALDYGFAHYTVVLLGCTDGTQDGVISQ